MKKSSLIFLVISLLLNAVFYSCSSDTASGCIYDNNNIFGTKEEVFGDASGFYSAVETYFKGSFDAYVFEQAIQDDNLFCLLGLFENHLVRVINANSSCEEIQKLTCDTIAAVMKEHLIFETAISAQIYSTIESFFQNLLDCHYDLPEILDEFYEDCLLSTAPPTSPQVFTVDETYAVTGKRKFIEIDLESDRKDVAPAPEPGPNHNHNVAETRIRTRSLSEISAEIINNPTTFVPLFFTDPRINNAVLDSVCSVYDNFIRSEFEECDRIAIGNMSDILLNGLNKCLRK